MLQGKYLLSPGIHHTPWMTAEIAACLANTLTPTCQGTWFYAGHFTLALLTFSEENCIMGGPAGLGLFLPPGIPSSHAVHPVVGL